MYVHERMSCAMTSMLRYETCSAAPTLTGEWSLAIDNCMDAIDRKFQDYGQCDRITLRSKDPWWRDHIKCVPGAWVVLVWVSVLVCALTITTPRPQVVCAPADGRVRAGAGLGLLGLQARRPRRDHRALRPALELPPGAFAISLAPCVYTYVWRPGGVGIP